jgi:hypothetical protein
MYVKAVLARNYQLVGSNLQPATVLVPNYEPTTPEVFIKKMLSQRNTKYEQPIKKHNQV